MIALLFEDSELLTIRHERIYDRKLKINFRFKKFCSSEFSQPISNPNLDELIREFRMSESYSLYAISL
jgi:hypothetical protein